MNTCWTKQFLVRQQYHLISHSPGLTNKRKTNEWQEVTRAVNEASATARTETEIRKKWADLKVGFNLQYGILIQHNL